MNYQPPYSITPQVLRLVAEVVELVTRWSLLEGSAMTQHVHQLRRNNRILTIQASLAMEHERLSVLQVGSLFDGIPVEGLPRDMQEVRNAVAAYGQLPAWQPQFQADLLAAHGLMMAGMADDAGNYRRGGASMSGTQGRACMAPPARWITRLMEDLLAWLASADVHPLIAGCVFHYEFSCIHPFSDGNGRLGRLWQTLIFSRWQPVLAYLPVEPVIGERKEGYQRAMAEADGAEDATPFLEFMLQAVLDTMIDVLLRASEKACEEVSEKTSEKNFQTSSEKASEKMTEKVSVKLSEKTSEKIMAALHLDRSMTIAELAITLSVSTRSIERNLQGLQEAGRLRRIGAARGGQWEVLE